MKKYITMLAVMLLVGCTQSVGPLHLAEAEVLCKKNGGVRSLTMGTLRFDVYCNNNAIFKDIVKTWPIEVRVKDGQAKL